MKKQQRKLLFFVLGFLLSLLTACGHKEYTVEYGIDGYVYLSRRLQYMEGVDDLKIMGDYLYYLQDGDKGTTVNRVSVASMVSGEGGLDFSGKETLVLFQNITFELPEGAEEKGEDIDFLAALDGRAEQSGSINMEKNTDDFR